MGFGNLGFGELMVILVIVLVLFGARRVPEIGASIGKGIREFKKNISDIDREVRDPIRERDRGPPRCRRWTRTLARWKKRRVPSRSA